MTTKGMTGVEMWSELKAMLANLESWQADLKDKSIKRKTIVKNMEVVLTHLRNKIQFEAGQKHAD